MGYRRKHEKGLSCYLKDVLLVVRVESVDAKDNCENNAIPTQEREATGLIALEEEVESTPIHLEENEEEFAEFVFAAATDNDSDTHEDYLAFQLFIYL